eukprot:PhM_4_TR15661/c0_g1_i1/m.66859
MMPNSSESASNATATPPPAGALVAPPAPPATSSHHSNGRIKKGEKNGEKPDDMLSSSTTTTDDSDDGVHLETPILRARTEPPSRTSRQTSDMDGTSSVKSAPNNTNQLNKHRHQRSLSHRPSTSFSSSSPREQQQQQQAKTPTKTAPPPESIHLSTDDEDDDELRDHRHPPHRLKQRIGESSTDEDELDSVACQSESVELQSSASRRIAVDQHSNHKTAAALVSNASFSDRGSVIMHSEVDTDVDGGPSWRFVARRGGADVESTVTSASTFSMQRLAPPRPAVVTANASCQVNLPTPNASSNSADLAQENDVLRAELERVVNEVRRLEQVVFRFAQFKAEWSGKEAEWEEEREELKNKLAAAVSARTAEDDDDDDDDDDDSVVDRLNRKQGHTPSNTSSSPPPRDGLSSDATFQQQEQQLHSLRLALNDKTEIIDSLLKERTKLLEERAALSNSFSSSPVKSPAPGSACARCQRQSAEIDSLVQQLSETRTQLNATYSMMAQEREGSRRELQDLRSHMQWLYGSMKDCDARVVQERYHGQIVQTLRGHMETIEGLIRSVRNPLVAQQQQPQQQQQPPKSIGR